jgi:hypothetical protein
VLSFNTTNQTFNLDHAINIGNTSSSIAGNIRWNGSDLQGYDGTSWDSLTAAGVWTQSGGDIYRPGGNVGIGTTTPSAMFDVAGNMELNDYIYFRNGSTDYLRNDGSNFILSNDLLPSVDDTYDLGSSSYRWQDLYLGPQTLHIGTSTTDEATISYDTTNNILNFNTDSTTNGDIAFNTDDLFVDKSSGNVGIGTTTPVATLDIHSNKDTSTSWWTNADASLKIVNDHLTGDSILKFENTQGRIVYGSATTSDKFIFTYRNSIENEYLGGNI